MHFNMPKDAVMRPLSYKESCLLQGMVSQKQKRLQKVSWRLIQVCLLVIIPLWLLTLLASHYSSQKTPWYLIALFWLVAGGAIALWSYLPERRKMVADLAKFERAAASCQVVVVGIQSKRMVAFEEEDDEGACYAFQLRNGQIRFVVGQDYYDSKCFPNSKFYLVHFMSDDGELLYCQLLVKGEKLDAIRTIPARVKLKLNIPDHLAIIDGDVDELERLLS
jgi:hypothetical protein